MNLHDRRLKLKAAKNPAEKTIKLIMNSMYGKNIQKERPIARYIQQYTKQSKHHHQHHPSSDRSIKDSVNDESNATLKRKIRRN
jgi:hypothetical protein